MERQEGEFEVQRQWPEVCDNFPKHASQGSLKLLTILQKETQQFHHSALPAGSAGGIGQPLALLLKMQPYVSELALYDIANVVGVAADLSHCNTPVKVIPAVCFQARLAGAPTKNIHEAFALPSRGKKDHVW